MKKKAGILSLAMITYYQVIQYTNLRAERRKQMAYAKVRNYKHS